MDLNRRNILAGIGGLAATVTSNALASNTAEAQTAMQKPGASPAAKPMMEGQPLQLPRKEDFIIEDGFTYINAAYTHPIPKVAMEAARNAAEARGTLHSQGGGGGRRGRLDPKTQFAELIGAKPSEIAYVSSTSAGENMAVQALGLHHDFRGNVVTDGLHYEGALMHLLELKKKGLDVRIVKPTKDSRIDMKDMEKVVDKNTRLIEVSSAAMYNGFEHDLKAVSDLAHAHGAYVYADIIHSAGTGPFDIKASGVDFAACSTFKWLMGDFGIGFLYVNEAILDKLERPVIGYYEAAGLEQFEPPFLPEGEYQPVSYKFATGTASMFEPGTFGGSAAAAALLSASLDYIKQIGLANIHAHRQPLLKKLREEVPRFGYVSVTPPGTTGGNITFAKENVMQTDLGKRLAAAKVNIRFSRNWIRLSPSVYNDMADVDRFLSVLT